MNIKWMRVEKSDEEDAKKWKKEGNEEEKGGTKEREG